MGSYKKISYSILELAFISGGSTVSQTLANSLDLAQKVEEMGYKRIWFAEHHNTDTIASSATSVIIGHIANHTKSIRVGSGGIMLPNHSPLLIAEQFGTLGILYPDRIDLGIGRAPGTDQVTAQAIRSDRNDATENFPSEMSSLLQFFSADNKTAPVRATVAEGVNVPVYMLGSSTDSAHLAAKMGLPYVFASHFSPAHLYDALRIYRSEFRPSAYLAEPYVIAAVNIIAAESDVMAEENFTSLLRFFVGVLTGRMEQLQRPVPINQELQLVREHPAVQGMLKYSFVGKKETVSKKVSKFMEETQADELMIVSNIYDHKDRVTSYRIAAEIMEELNNDYVVHSPRVESYRNNAVARKGT